MGSKSGMLTGRLGEQLLELATSANRFVDLFAGSGAVSRFISTRLPVETVSIDLLQFSGVITAATTGRTQPLNSGVMWDRWNLRATGALADYESLYVAAAALSQPASAGEMQSARELCRIPVRDGFIWADYGGYYFSPKQALELSMFYRTLPARGPERTVALAALLRTASRASASPGHTAQPFRPTDKLLPHIRSAWRIDVPTELRRQLDALAPAPALIRGSVVTGDSVAYAEHYIEDGDLVFCDPPYSDAQYSRFYHVLEGIAIGGWPAVFGAGRAPASQVRAASKFSGSRNAALEAGTLIRALAQKRTTVLWTYPEGERSNGLTVDAIRGYANDRFVVSETRIPMRHSTLGGSHRNLHEVLFLFRPRD
ncbi:DNA adenine methylase [Curtobacterium flaccumfaciens]|uniref:DNA adenine methylase n=1 Tax=Curtobacterium flaccumfaciens TaxID=2035 RepID=UPI00217D95FE|nr:DNA adenine methylase [Curtobacterium flaccumfaciens]MCS6589532.1 DNA adenine methylase [Curtobacterium flaccumfaciens pv. flaccumfaciens]